MKKTLIASAIALTSIAATNANANIAITEMNFSGTSAASGSVNDDGTGSFTGSFFGHTWLATVETGVITTGSGSWAGTNGLGTWDFSAAIATLGATEVAVGTFFDWNSNTDIAVLAIFDCAGGVCTGVNTNADQGMQTGPFLGAKPAFNGTGDLSAVPVPAAAWLMGSGLLGLVGVARRRKVA